MSEITDRIINDHEIPPVAKGVICVDYDATLVPWGELDSVPEPLPGAVKALQRFKEAGYKIVILTSRMSPTWWAAEGWPNSPQIASRWWYSVADVLERHGIPFDMITAEKVPAVYYIDDRAVSFRNNWEEIERMVLG